MFLFSIIELAAFRHNSRFLGAPSNVFLSAQDYAKDYDCKTSIEGLSLIRPNMEDQRQLVARYTAAGKTTREAVTAQTELYGSQALKLRQIQRIYHATKGLGADDGRRNRGSIARPRRGENVLRLVEEPVCDHD